MSTSNHPSVLTLAMARDVSGLGQTDREHLRGLRGGPPGSGGPPVARGGTWRSERRRGTRILRASEPGLALPDDVDAAFADDSPHPGEIWRIGRDEALLNGGRLFTTPLTLSPSCSTWSSATRSSPWSSTKSHIHERAPRRAHRRAWACWAAGPAPAGRAADVADQVHEVINVVMEGRPPTGVEVGPPITAPDDQRIEYRQVIADLLADLSPGQWDAGTPAIVADDTSPDPQEQDIQEESDIFLPEFAPQESGKPIIPK